MGSEHGRNGASAKPSTLDATVEKGLSGLRRFVSLHCSHPGKDAWSDTFSSNGETPDGQMPSTAFGSHRSGTWAGLLGRETQPSRGSWDGSKEAIQGTPITHRRMLVWLRGETAIGSFFAAGHDKVAESAVILVKYGGVAAFLHEHGFGPGGRNPRKELETWRSNGGKTS